MTWTSEKPTVAGWYWNRINGTVGIALIMRRDCQLYAWLRFKDAWLSREGWLDYIHGEWLGPLTPDSYQQGRVAGLREAVPLACKYCNDRTKWTPMSNSGYHVCNMPEPDFVRCQAIKIHAALAQAAQDEKGVGDAGR